MVAGGAPEGKFEDDEAYPFLEVSREEKAQNAAKPFDSKKNCWIPDTEDGKRFNFALLYIRLAMSALHISVRWH